MGYGNCVLTLATPENIEVVGEAGIPYIDEFDLAGKLRRVLRDGSLVQAYRNRAQLRIQNYYDWEKVVDQYENLFRKMTGLNESSNVTEVEETKELVETGN
jgi:glycosyltransferase involved in cell wall biosynthesis